MSGVVSDGSRFPMYTRRGSVRDDGPDDDDPLSEGDDAGGALS